MVADTENPKEKFPFSEQNKEPENRSELKPELKPEFRPETRKDESGLSSELSHRPTSHAAGSGTNPSSLPGESHVPESRPIERGKAPGRSGARGTAAMDPKTRQEVARKGGLAVSRNKQHMAEIGRKGGQSVSKNREHMAQIGRKGGAASRGHR